MPDETPTPAAPDETVDLGTKAPDLAQPSATSPDPAPESAEGVANTLRGPDPTYVVSDGKFKRGLLAGAVQHFLEVTGYRVLKVEVPQKHVEQIYRGEGGVDVPTLQERSNGLFVDGVELVEAPTDHRG